MYPFWRSNTGKLVIGGCGTQIGMLFAFGGLTATLLFCSFCVILNALGVGLSQELIQGPGDAPPEAAQASPPQDAIESTLGEINSLLTELEILQASGVAVVPATGANLEQPH